MKPRNNPPTDAPHEKKFRKNVDSITRMTIKKGRIMPRNIRTKPRLRRRRGLFISNSFALSGVPNASRGTQSKRKFESNIYFH
jgi:hypothetical protein